MRLLFPLSLVFLIGCTQVAPGNATDAGDSTDAGLPDAGPSDGGTVDAGPLPALDPIEGITRYCHDTAAATCGNIGACSCPLEFRGGDVESCTDARAATCESALNQYLPLFQQGVTKITAQTIADCVAGLNAIGSRCGELTNATVPTACAGYFMDTASLGETCFSPGTLNPCADGAGHCKRSTFGETCTPNPKEGEACAGGKVCAAGLLCLNQQTCVRPGAIGAACDSKTSCEPALTCGLDGKCAEPYSAAHPCEQTWQCGEGFLCDQGNCQPAPALGSACSSEFACGSARACAGSTKFRKCSARAAVNEPCLSHEECDAGLACSEDSYLCVTLPAEDEPCLNRQLCAAGLACDENEQKCVTPPGQGDPCLIGNALCADGLACDANNVCQPPPSNDGDECAQPGNVCGAGLACDFTASGSYCHARRDVGGACENDAICKDGLHCDFDTLKCAEPFPLNAPCRLGNECGPGRECSRLGGEGYRCRELPTAGAPCEFTCGDGFVCRGAGGECAKAICGTR